ncbi:MAG: pilus assembly PilX N-terminal domain-containing protein [Candidatus Levybacteria bacterium]|nr:pilus assembly PilX N-terminal domain-containing protein [Candidatus Levybacteria bacterium]
MEKGQTLLIIVLIMVVGLTVGLAVASRSIINVRTSTEEENSQRAFSAAEAGVEQALRKGCLSPTGTTCTPILAQEFTDNMKSTFNADITSVSGSSLNGNALLLNGGNPVPKDDGIDVWLVSHDSSGKPDYTNRFTANMTVHWGILSDQCSSDPLQNTMAAIEAIVISGTVSNPQTNRYTYDPCSSENGDGSRRNTNNFANAAKGNAGNIGGVTFNYKTNIHISNGLVMRIIPIYASTPIGIDANNQQLLPSQGNKIDSIGTSGLTKRKVIYYKGYPALPVEFFQYILFSPK